MFNLGDTVTVKNEFGHESIGKIIHVDGRERDKEYWVCSSTDPKKYIKTKTPAMVLVEKCVSAKEKKAEYLNNMRTNHLASLASEPEAKEKKTTKAKKHKEEN